MLLFKPLKTYEPFLFSIAKTPAFFQINSTKQFHVTHKSVQPCKSIMQGQNEINGIEYQVDTEEIVLECIIHFHI